MGTNNYQDMTSQELAAKSRELRKELFNLRLQQVTARLEKPHRLREIRREIARCETSATQKAGAQPAKKA
ncbi:MAG TPA: 50S ribosomal protein L29 [Candidatus Limnocylindria bacterium]|jgi:large subunit ribosomal protein L29|nr:50S ribosomal protein L29 [Candidatus Limnocylindria bacterium]